MEKPILTLPSAEGDLVRREYTRANCILEYGSGGSTVVASDLPGKTVFSVESDRAWHQKMVAWFQENPSLSSITMHYSDIGPTKEWGFPTSDVSWKNYIEYPFGVWSKYPQLNPDIVLVDGRFRVGCFIACVMNTKQDCTILYDDYSIREPYWVVEKIVKPVEVVGRMARFEITPGTEIPMSFSEIVKLCTEAQ
jgi:hypothetical protein